MRSNVLNSLPSAESAYTDLCIESYVCRRFIERHGLSTTYREQIVQFIVQNTGVQVPMDFSSNPDPFTGGGAYIPSTPASHHYQQNSSSVTGGGVDPFTGSTSTSFIALGKRNVTARPQISSP